MGCMCTRDESKETVNEVFGQKKYSWDEKKQTINPENFIIENLNDQEEIRIPGSVNGQQFIIQNCKDSTIYVLDHMNAVTVDDCINCKIVLGPVKGSVFIRNCKSCTCVAACGQFRMRDSTKIYVFLYSKTQPIIEASSGIHFGNYQLHYNEIQAHFERALLDSKKTDWKIIYDFTPVDCGNNWDFIKKDRVSLYIAEPKSETVKGELSRLGMLWICEQENLK